MKKDAIGSTNLELLDVNQPRSKAFWDFKQFI